jgi:hypothetical protein
MVWFGLVMAAALVVLIAWVGLGPRAPGPGDGPRDGPRDRVAGHEAAPIPGLRGRLDVALRTLAALIVGLVVARGLGGMLQRPEVYAPTLLSLRWPPGWSGQGPSGGGLGAGLWHHAVNVGLPALALVPLTARALRGRRALVGLWAALLGGALLAPQLVRYPFSADTEKFLAAATLAGSLAWAATVDAALGAVAGRPGRGPGPAGPSVVLAVWVRRGLRLGVVGGGLLTASYLLVPLARPHTVYDAESRPRRADRVVALAADRVWAEGYRLGELVWAQSNVARELAVFGGLSAIGFNVDYRGIGIRPERLRAVVDGHERIRRELSREALDALDVRWLVISDEELRNLGPAARAVLAEPPEWLERVAVIEPELGPRRRTIWRISREAATLER